MKLSSLPIHNHFAEIATLLTKHQVILVAGETGSGKSTQLPQLCYQLFKDRPGLIGHTQPRRIAAKTIAARIAEEMQTPLGGLTGYQIRFNDALSQDTHIKIMTDGILLAETRDDPLLKHYHTLIIDEAHERSLNIDFLLGYLKQILPQRPDLKLIITSATLDHERLAKHFAAPVFIVEGRTYPVSIRYQPLNTKGRDAFDALYSGIISALLQLQQEASGDVLVFLPTEREIREYRRKLAERFLPYEVLPLYARLPLSSQQKIFHSGNRPRIILTTNVAETSVTVPNVRYVIDSGLARVSRFNAKLKIQRLPIEAISQANAKQRAGRAGRTRDGIVIRLYTEEDLQNRPSFLEPELLRTSLSAVILMMLKLKLQRIENFPFIDPPPNNLIHEGYKELLALQAIAEKNSHYILTRIGEQMSRFPLDPRLARMLVAGREFRVLPEILAIVSNLTIQDPREYPEEMLTKAQARHQRYAHPESEFLSILNLWNIVRTETQGFSNNQFKRYCEQHFLSVTRMREWQALHHELSEVCEKLGWEIVPMPEATAYQAVHQSILTGSLHFIGYYDDEKQCFRGAENKLFQIFPGSALAKKKFKWVMSESLMETQKVYARIVARIEANWLEPISRHLVKKQYSEPHYDNKMDEVIAYETVLLYGLPIITRRKTLFAKKDPALAREIFIREGLLPKQDQDAKALLMIWEAKLRRSGICFTEEEAFTHYNTIVSPEAVSFKTLSTPPAPFGISERLRELYPFLEQYPDQWQINGKSFTLNYVFDPLSDEDGISMQLHLDDLPDIPDTLSAWLPKGLLQEKITILLRELPKSMRRLFIPIPDTAKAIMASLKDLPINQDFYSILAKALSQRTEEPVKSSELEMMLSEIDLPAYLQLRFNILNAEGKILKTDISIAALKKAFADELHTLINQKQATYDNTVYTNWEFADLPAQVDKAYPALTPVQNGVQIKLYHDIAEAAQIHGEGIFVLAKVHFHKELKALKSVPAVANELGKLTFITNKTQLTESFLDYALWRFFDEQEFDLSAIKTKAIFQDLLTARANFYTYSLELQKWLNTLTAPLLDLRIQLKNLSQKHGLAVSVHDLQNQFNALCTPGLFKEVPRVYLKRYPVYFKGMQLRIEKLINNPERELRLFAEFITCFKKYQQNIQLYEKDLRWIFEEYRISLFAQELKTLFPISTKKMQELLNR